MRNHTNRKLVDKPHENNCSSMKLTKTLDLLARPRGFEPMTLVVEMREFVVTNREEVKKIKYFLNYFYPFLKTNIKV